MHAPGSYSRTCRSPSPFGPPSISGFAGIGYGPRSLSRPYSKLTVLRAVPAGTVVTGMPNGAPSMVPEPKSGWACLSAPTLPTHCADRGCTGSLDTSARYTLSAGMTAQPAGLAEVEADGLALALGPAL